MEIVRAIRYSDRATMQDILHKIIRRTTTRRAYLLEDLVARAAAAALVQVQGAGRPLQARQARYLLRPLVGARAAIGCRDGKFGAFQRQPGSAAGPSLAFVVARAPAGYGPAY